MPANQTCGTCRHRGAYCYECECGCGMSLHGCYTFLPEHRTLVAATDSACSAWAARDGGGMHAGSLTGNTAAARVYGFLRERRGEWVDGWTLTQEARVTAVGTRVSEVRHQLAARPDLCERVEQTDRLDGRRGSWYRLVYASGQTDMWEGAA